MRSTLPWRFEVSHAACAGERSTTSLIAAHLDRLRKQSRERLERAGNDGTRVVAYLPGGFVPEELIYASGAIPVCLAEADSRAAEAALSVVPSVICPFARAQIGRLLLEEDPVFRVIDLLVVPSTCQHLKKIGDVWEYIRGPQVFKLGVPYEHDKDFELEYYRDRLLALKERLEDLTGNRISKEKLSAAADAYNRVRRLLRALGQTRLSPRRPDAGGHALSMVEFARLNHASFYADPVAMAASLEEICAAIPSSADLPARAPSSPTESRPRLLLMGPNLAAGDYGLFEMVINAGADIVVEDIFEGIRDYRQTVDLSGDKDPIEALARAYLVEKRPAAFMRGTLPRRLEFALDLIRCHAVSGVLWYQLFCCEFYDEEAGYFEMALRERGIPMLIVESDYRGLDSGPLKTRLAAFVETLSGGPLQGAPADA